MGSLGLFGPLRELLEPINATSSIDEFLLAGIERMALRADLRIDRFIGRARDELVAADASDLDFFVICRVDAGLHRLI